MTTNQKLIYDELKSKYKRLSISKSEMAHELGISYSSIDNYLSKSYGLPPHKKLGDKKNSKVIFLITDVAEFLSQTVKVL